MRLLNVDTFELEEFVGAKIPRYAILSHTWGPDEVLFADLQSGNYRHKEGFRKIEFTLKQARNDGLKWYYNAVRCYAYLSDVQEYRDLPNSRWFTRGWTFQELIAPREVEFFSCNWSYLCSRNERSALLSNITCIDAKILRSENEILTESLRSYSVAQRLSWAANRQTTRAEDRAYSLMGLFDVNMPLLYGEGDKAFRRLQEEIVKKTGDLSILAWSDDDRMAELQDDDGFLPILASSPDDFKPCTGIVTGTNYNDFDFTRYGLRLTAPVLPISSHNGDSLVALLLDCRLGNEICATIALKVTLRSQTLEDAVMLAQGDIVKCSIGWPSERGTVLTGYASLNERLCVVDTFQAHETAHTEIIHIFECAYIPDSVASNYAYTHVWVQFSGGLTDRKIWEIEGLLPDWQRWNAESMVYAFGSDEVGFREIAGIVVAIEHWNETHEVALLFGQSSSHHFDFTYGFGPWDSKPVSQPTGFHSTDILDGLSLKVALTTIEMAGARVAHLAVTVDLTSESMEGVDNHVV